MPDVAPASAQDAARVTGDKAKATVTVDLDLCKACGICVTLCPTHVFESDAAGKAVVVRPRECTACRLCEWHCPDFAIEVLVEHAAAATTEPEDA